MKFIIFASLLALAAARPDSGYTTPSYSAPGSRRADSDEHIAIVRDDQVHSEDGSFSSDIETANGIFESRSGARLEGVEGNPIGQQGQVQFTFPNGEQFSLKFVADENGYQPESSHLPVAPEFPHPIPQFVIDQIEKAAREHAEAARRGDDSDETQSPSQKYSSRF